MNLKEVKLQTTWNDAAEVINANTRKLNLTIGEFQNNITKNKGYFASAESLSSTYPTSINGSIAYVGSSYPYTIYRWDSSTNSWINTGVTGGDETVELTEYYTKEETHEAIKDEYEVIPQSVYDALTSYEDKLYFCTEE